MQKGIVGKKLGMTQLFDANGNVVPVTVIEAGPCVIAQKKTTENDGYEAVQIGFGDLKAAKVNKPMKGHFAKGDVAPKKVLRELRFDDCSTYNVGDIIKADIFAEGDKVENIVDVAEKRIFDIASNNEKRDFVHIRDVIVQTYNHLSELQNDDSEEKLGLKTGYGDLD